jgi:hypothetical protein
LPARRFIGIGRCRLRRQHERGQLELALQRHEVADVRREGAQAGGNRLRVADVGKRPFETR